MVFYTTYEVAEILKVSEQTISDWIRKGKLGGMKIGGTKTIRVSHQDLEVFFEANRIKA